MTLNYNLEAFLALIRNGLFPTQDKGAIANDPESCDVDWRIVYRLAQEQSTQGLVLAGMEGGGKKPPKEVLLHWIGDVQQLELRNLAMNGFVAKLIDKLRKENIYCLLVKGQGLAQCYEKPLWRCAGDIDLLLSDDNYKQAKGVLIPSASEVSNEDEQTKHQAMVIKGFDVELHGKMPFAISKRVDNVIDEVLNDVFYRGAVRTWDCNGTLVFLPSPNNDVILVFTHFLHHFFIEGVGLRQICDWCRLLWTYHSELDLALLESRLRRMGLLSEWKAFAALAVNRLGMPVDAMPFYDSRFKNKGEKVLRRVLKCGNFGHNNDLSYRTKYTGLSYKVFAAWRRFIDFVSMIPLFPIDVPKFFVNYMLKKVK